MKNIFYWMKKIFIFCACILLIIILCIGFIKVLDYFNLNPVTIIWNQLNIKTIKSKNNHIRLYEITERLPKNTIKIAYSQGTDEVTGDIIIILRYIERVEGKWFDWNTGEEIFLDEYPKVLCLMDDPFSAR
jgi:hypothetical protein